MIVLNVTYKCKPGTRQKFLESINEQGIGEACRAEEGNYKYDYYIPADGCEELILLEKWRNAEDLARHGTQPHMARLAKLKALYVEEMILEKFEVPDKEPENK